MSASYSFPTAPEEWSDDIEHRRMIAQVVNQILQGKTNNASTVSLNAGTTTTTITDRNIGGNSVVILIPLTANAAAALATTYQTFPNTGKWQAVINHANNVQTDRQFRYVVIG